MGGEGIVKTRRIGIVMPKGGVGKTATTAALAWGLRDAGRRVLVVDLDPQRPNVTMALGIDPSGQPYTVRELILMPDREFAPVKVEEGIDLVPSETDHLIMTLTETQLIQRGALSGPTFLDAALRRVADRYNYIVCDCRPGGGPMTANVLRACTEIIAPVELTRYAAQAIPALRGVLEIVCPDGSGPKVKFLGTFWRDNQIECREAAGFVADLCQGALYETRIPDATVIARALAEATSIFAKAYRGLKGPAEYRSFVAEVLAEEGERARVRVA
jgi:chromosome partitioning protein